MRLLLASKYSRLVSISVFEDYWICLSSILVFGRVLEGYSPKDRDETVSVRGE